MNQGLVLTDGTIITAYTQEGNFDTNTGKIIAKRDLFQIAAAGKGIRRDPLHAVGNRVGIPRLTARIPDQLLTVGGKSTPSTDAYASFPSLTRISVSPSASTPKNPIETILAGMVIVST